MRPPVALRVDPTVELSKDCRHQDLSDCRLTADSLRRLPARVLAVTEAVI